jgi:hypothetical protein
MRYLLNYPLSYGVPVRERYGSTLLPATREQHGQNCYNGLSLNALNIWEIPTINTTIYNGVNKATVVFFVRNTSL